jgi:hypothetical protein
MANKAAKALESAKGLAEMVESMIGEANDLDLQRLLKQIEADLMDIQHKLAIAIRLSEKR